MRSALICRTVCLLAFLSNFPVSPAYAQDSDASSVNWAYSSYFGSGWYQIEGDQDVYVLRMTPRWTTREFAIDRFGNRRMGVKFKLPITAGLNVFELDNIPGALEPENLSSLSITPGVDIEIPVTTRWLLRPFASLGWGTILNDSESAWTYWGGIKSRYGFQSGKLGWALLNSVGFVGHSPSSGPSEKFWPLSIGFEFDYPVFQPTDNDAQLFLYWHLNYTTFEDDVDFDTEIGKVDPIVDQWEIALAIGKREGRIKVWFMEFDRLGLGYRASSNGELRGITFVFRSLFDL